MIAGNDDLAVFAWSDAGPTPNVHVYQYLLPSQIIDLRGTASRMLSPGTEGHVLSRQAISIVLHASTDTCR